MKVAVVLLNWNGRRYLEQFLPSTLAHSQEADVYVIDNGSTDDSLSFLKQYPTVTTIALDKNYGFAGGYSKGLATVEADLLCLLNTDVEVSPNWLLPMIEHFTKHPDVAIAQPHLLDFHNRSRFEYAGAAGGFIDALGYAYCRGRIFNVLEENAGQYDETIDIHWASGACFFIRKSVFDQLQGFDDRFFAHQEEIDLCWRARNLGYRIQAIKGVPVYHVGGGTLPPSPFKVYLNFRNTLAMLTKNLPLSVLYQRLFLRLILDGVAGVRFLFLGQWRNIGAIIKAHFHFYRQFPKYINSRTSSLKSHNPAIYAIIYQHFIKKIKKFSDLPFKSGIKM